MSLRLEFQIGNVVIFAKLLQLREVQNMEWPFLMNLRLWRYRDRYVHGNCDVCIELFDISRYLIARYIVCVKFIEISSSIGGKY